MSQGTAPRASNRRPVAKLVIRGEIIEDNLIEIGGRDEDFSFLTPDISHYVSQLPMGNPIGMADLHELSFDDVLDYLEALGKRLDPATNPLIREACELSYGASPLTPSIIDFSFSPDVLGAQFRRENTIAVADQVGRDYMEGWVEKSEPNGGATTVRCYGARTLFIVAGNSPIVSAMALIRCILLRSDGIFKAPSNDPFTATAIVQTMAEMAPDHPITKHVSVGYWSGGDQFVEEKLYQPHNLEKICAWGGYASMKHVAQYIQPGLELISFDPKVSGSYIGAKTFASEETMREAAALLAMDVGSINQVGCSNSRLVYAECGTDDEGVDKLRQFGQYVYDAIMQLPEEQSTKPKHYDSELKRNVDALRLDDDWYTVIGGDDNEGAVVVSHLNGAVAFSSTLIDRTTNLIPIDGVDEVLNKISAYTQTIGVYPEETKHDISHKLALAGVQRFVSLGSACESHMTGPGDGLEPLRRMGKWIANEINPRFKQDPAQADRL